MVKWVAAFVVAPAVAVAAPAAVAPSGLRGVVRRGPTQPVCQAGQPCSEPAQTTLVFTRLGHRFLARAAVNGAYRILLPPGIYSVATAPKIGFGVVRPAHVHVRRGHVDHLDFYADTGIR
jgi:hypothetical protein